VKRTIVSKSHQVWSPTRTCEGLGGIQKVRGAKISIPHNFENFLLPTGSAG